MKLASGFCIPEPFPVHTGIKRRQVHPLIRFLLQSRVDEKSADLHKAFHLCFVPGWRYGAITVLTSIKRVGDLQAFSVSEECLVFGLVYSHVVLRPRPGYVPKVPTTLYWARCPYGLIPLWVIPYVYSSTVRFPSW